MNYTLSFPATVLECGGWGWNCEEVTYINPATVEWIDSSGRVRKQRVVFLCEKCTGSGDKHKVFFQSKRKTMPKYFLSIWHCNNTQ